MEDVYKSLFDAIEQMYLKHVSNGQIPPPPAATINASASAGGGGGDKSATWTRLRQMGFIEIASNVPILAHVFVKLLADPNRQLVVGNSKAIVTVDAASRTRIDVALKQILAANTVGGQIEENSPLSLAIQRLLDDAEKILEDWKHSPAIAKINREFPPEVDGPERQEKKIDVSKGVSDEEEQERRAREYATRLQNWQQRELRKEESRQAIVRREKIEEEHKKRILQLLEEGRYSLLVDDDFTYDKNGVVILPDRTYKRIKHTREDDIKIIREEERMLRQRKLDAEPPSGDRNRNLGSPMAGNAAGNEVQKQTGFKIDAESRKKLEEQIPKEKADLFAFVIDWQRLKSSHLLHTVIKQWVSERITSYFGIAQNTLVDFVLLQLEKESDTGGNNTITATDRIASLRSELVQVFDEECDLFLSQLWRELVLCTLALRQQK